MRELRIAVLAALVTGLFAPAARADLGQIGARLDSDGLASLFDKAAQAPVRLAALRAPRTMTDAGGPLLRDTPVGESLPSAKRPSRAKAAEEIPGAPAAEADSFYVPAAPAAKEPVVKRRPGKQAPAFARSRHQETVKQLQQLVQEKQDFLNETLNRGLTVPQQVARGLREFTKAAAGFFAAAATIKIDFSLLHKMWNDMFANAFGVVPAEMMTSVSSLALQSLVAVAAAHIVYDHLSQNGRAAYKYAMWTMAMVGAAAGGAIIGGDAIVANLPQAAPLTQALLGAKPALLPGMVASFAAISTGIGGIASTKATEALFKLMNTQQIYADDRAHIDRLQERISEKHQELQELHATYPHLEREVFPAVPVE